MLFHKISIIGIGLLGGSLGLAARQQQLARRIEGFVRRSESVAECRALNVADEISTDLAAVLSDADLIVVCTPVEHMRGLLEPVKHSIKKGAVITDVGSVKEGVVREMNELADSAGATFVGSHPMAGSEKVGVARARADLFDQAVCAVTPTAETDAASLNRVTAFWQALRMKVLQIPPSLHDQLVCRVSHLPHLLASVLSGYVLADHFPSEQRQLAAGGFRDTTRVASGPVDMWQGILSANHHHLIADIDALAGLLQEVKQALVNNDPAALKQFLQTGHDRREQWLKERGME